MDMIILRRVLLIVGFSSMAVWIAIGVYLRATNQWGAFAVAYLALPLFLIAAAEAAVGAVVCVWSWRQRRIDVPMSLVTFVHGYIIYYAS